MNIKTDNSGRRVIEVHSEKELNDLFGEQLRQRFFAHFSPRHGLELINELCRIQIKKQNLHHA